MFGELFRVFEPYLPEAPPPERDPHRWGQPEPVRELFSADGLVVSPERHSLDIVFESSEAWVDFQAANTGTLIAMRKMLAEQGKWDEVRAALVEVYESFNRAGDGSLRAPTEDLLTKVTVG
jgi:hypothetical protein